MSEDSSDIELSIVIPAKNEVAAIGDVVTKARSAYPDAQIIVVYKSLLHHSRSWKCELIEIHILNFAINSWLRFVKSATNSKNQCHIFSYFTVMITNFYAFHMHSLIFLLNTYFS